MNLYVTGIGRMDEERSQLLAHLKALDVKIQDKDKDKFSLEDLRKKFDQAIERKKHG